LPRVAKEATPAAHLAAIKREREANEASALRGNKFLEKKIRGLPLMWKGPRARGIMRVF
jgi:hypothetical protein